MITKIRKWGNGLAVCIPKAVAKDARVEEGMDVDISESNGRLVVRPITTSHYELSDLLEGVSKRNLHGAADFREA